MKEIDVREQPLLSFAKTTRIALAGVKYRLFRSIVTVAVIAVAMAFLMNILSESLIKKAVSLSAREGIEEIRRTDKWVAKLSVPQSYAELITVLAAPDGFSKDRNMLELDELDPDQQARIQRLAGQAAVYLTFFDELNYGRRRVLVGSAASTRILDLLQDDARRERLAEALTNMRSVRFPGDPEAFSAFLGEWPTLRDYLGNVRENQRAAIQSVQDALNQRTMLTAMQQADGPFGERIRSVGFDLPEEEAVSLTAQAMAVADNNLIAETINRPELRQAVAARYDVLPGDVSLDQIWSMLAKPVGASWYLERMREGSLDLPERLTSERLTDLSSARAESRLYLKAERLTTEAGGGFMGIGERMTWLAFVSMLVCVVGIANAMLMSVTERFREIATLKCLGALDGFIMTVFLIEASVLGLVGGVVGTLLGLALCLTRMFSIFHSLVSRSFPLNEIVLAAVLSIAAGVILAAVAAVYPSFRAARLAPMEAMRIE